MSSSAAARVYRVCRCLLAAGEFSFVGALIIEAVVTELATLHELSTASDIYLAGTRCICSTPYRSPSRRVIFSSTSGTLSTVRHHHHHHPCLLRIKLRINITRKRGKTQRVARPACANATVHFLPTYRLAIYTSLFTV